MEIGKGEIVTTALRNLQLDNNNIVKPKSTRNSIGSTVQSDFFTWNKGKAAPSLVSLCMGVVGSNLEDVTDDLADIALTFPSDIKMVLLAIARRRKLLNDDILIALADSSFEILDISGSDVSDFGLCRVVDICQNLRAVDISQCRSLTSTGVSKLLQHCHSLEILRWGCLSLLKPDLNNMEGESWEELDTVDLTHGAKSLHWLVWDSEETLAIECPRIVVNPKPSLWGFRGTEVPREALSQSALDEPIVRDIDPKTWAVSGFNASRTTTLKKVATPNELSVAEKFRLAFLERDTRLAPKRAKNARQHERRAKREWVMMDTRAKALALASKATSSVNLRNL
ncbi:hypothetical protein PHJA_000054800 [Phtheirospermum japonicum]|uniref:RNI-like superfamily protein n=1 Tax=Phtheirospermum japonicum TaxID=374723 RepID=A0A830B369_9LAMI|nr:hypothetical protein PHJA_000054800 [Phtheirospermum japonicum]